MQSCHKDILKRPECLIAMVIELDPIGLGLENITPTEAVLYVEYSHSFRVF